MRACINAIGSPTFGQSQKPLIVWFSQGVSVAVLGHEGVDAFNKLIQYLLESCLEGKLAKQIYAKKTLKTKAQQLISDIVNQYGRYSTKDQISTMIDEWILHFHTDFPSTPYYVPIINLKLADLLIIGRVTFYPRSAKFVDKLISSCYYEANHTEVLPGPKETLRKRAVDLFQPDKCGAIAEVLLGVDETLGYELCANYTEQALNVLRYYGYFLYPRSQQAYIGIKGRLLRGKFGSLHDIPGGTTGLFSRQIGPLVPYDLSGKNLNQIGEQRLDFLSKLLLNETINELESSLLAAIEWLGRASQSVEPETRYLNLWIAIESLVTCEADRKREETPGQLIAKRISMFLPFVDDNERDKMRNYWNDKLYQVRCDLVHRGYSEELADLLPNLEFYAPRVIMYFIEKLTQNHACSTQNELFSSLD